jgi:dipeptidyl aminopeptidase/acylaminoacyl peptidase
MKKQSVEFKVGEDTLRGALFIPDGKGPFPAVIFFHGSGSTGDTYFEASEKLANNGILAFMFNFRGCGISEGDFSKQTIGMGIEDAKAGLNYFLAINEIDKKRVGLTGSSFGGFLAALLSSDFDFKSIALIVPAAYSPAQMDTFHTDDPDVLKIDFDKSVSYEKIHNFKNDLLIVQSELDDILPEGMVEKYLEVSTNAKKVEHLVLKGTKHRIKLFPEAKKLLLNKLSSWFFETL